MQNLKEKIAPKHTSLIIIDIQNDFASPDPQFFRASRGGDLSLVDPMVDKLEQLIPIAQKAGILTLYTQQIYDPTKLTLLQQEQYVLDGKTITCDISTAGYKFYRLQPPASAVYAKHNFNIFSNPQLVAALETHHIKTLVITGMDILFCVETAIRNGYDLGYKIVVPQDMVAGNAKSQEANARTFELVKKTFGVLTDFSELSSIWSAI